MRHLLPRTLPELLSHAIAYEREAASRFHEYSSHLHELGAHRTAEAFQRMELIERAHLQSLEECVGGGELPTLQPADYMRHLLATRDALELAFPHSPRSAREALVLALAAERRAEIYYRDAAANAADPRVRGLAADLAAGEHRHVRVVERLLAYAATGGPTLEGHRAAA
ncbi:MAG: ferritin-like domain-containing protein [Burkholderiales bacterium]